MQTRPLFGSALLAAMLFTAGGAAHAEPVHYKIEPHHTFVTFEVLHFKTSTVRGRFDRTDGSITLDREARTGKAQIAIDMRSINSGIAEFDQHLASSDFFDSAKYPEARFAGNDFRFEGDRLVSVSGTLTLLGRTEPTTLKALRFNCYQQPVLKESVCGGDFETLIKRSQWGMTWGIDLGVPDDVRLVIQVEAVRR